MPWFRSVLVVLVLSCVAPAADWPQWLGPNRDGSSPETIAPWKESPKVLWRKPVGEGHSSPIVVGDKVFLHTKVQGRNAEAVTAYYTLSGEQMWHETYEHGPFTSLFGNGPRATPAVDKGRLYTVGITGIVTCFDTASGKQIWQVDCDKQFHPPALTFGRSCSPLLEGKGVLVNVGAKGASIVSFDQEKGEVLWKSQDDKASYSSGVALGKASERQTIFLTQQGLVSLNPADGTLFWRYRLVDLLSESATTPVLVGDLLFASSITIGGVGLQLQNRDGKPAIQETWKNPLLTCYFSTPVPVKDQLYLVTGTKPPALKIESTLRCIDPKTGKELWQKPKVGDYHASLLRTGDNKLLMLEETGNLVLVDPNPDKYQELARAKICGKTWAHPALSEGRFYIRDEKELICVELPRGK